MIFNPTAIPGCFEIQNEKKSDNRGFFIKTFHNNIFESHGIKTLWKEEYFSKSIKNVLRGLHFQVPPHDHDKLVYCINGEILDVVVDLRQNSPTFKNIHSTVLSEKSFSSIFIPKGCAHGFLTLSNEATVVYKTSTEYSPEHDKGILWNSIQFSWPLSSPVISIRDEKFPKLSDFNSPFIE